MGADDKVVVIYDPECPICDFYCSRVAPHDGTGEIELINARSDVTLLPEITARGWDIDEGMVVKVGNDLYYGTEAIHQLSLASSGKGLIGPLSRLFRNRSLATRLYPVFRNMRNGLLKILGRTRINNLGRANHDRF